MADVRGGVLSPPLDATRARLSGSTGAGRGTCHNGVTPMEHSDDEPGEVYRQNWKMATEGGGRHSPSTAVWEEEGVLAIVVMRVPTH
jgi:hypothetical protein